jgi:hypothetical protein
MTDALDHLIGHTDHRALTPTEHAALRKAIAALRSQLKNAATALESAHNVMVFGSRDWGAHRRDAWLYGLIVGWDSDPVDGPEVLAEVASDHDWPPAEVARLQALHTALAALRLPTSTQSPGRTADAPLTTR